MSVKKKKIFEPKIFGLMIGLFIFFVFLLLKLYTSIPQRLELKVFDTFLMLKPEATREIKTAEGRTQIIRTHKISDDILILGIDFKTLSNIGKWPFDRAVHANLINGFTRVTDISQRENSILLDIFFVEPQKDAYNDALLVKSIQDNNRVFLETVLELGEPPLKFKEELYKRQKTLVDTYGEIKNIKGNWEAVMPFYGMQPPLVPYGKAVKGYGHANYIADEDKIFRRQPLIAKLSTLIDVIPVESLTPDYKLNRNYFERLAWVDKEGFEHSVKYPLTNQSIIELKNTLKKMAPPVEEDTDSDGVIDKTYYIVKKYRDEFIPAITLSLALQYMNKSLDDVEVVLGKYIKIKNPQKFNSSTGKWETYKIVKQPAQYKDGEIIKQTEYQELDELKIPIDEQGKMLINFMGPGSDPTGYQTFPVKSYYAYATNIPPSNQDKWRPSRGVANKIILVGAFAKGMAADEKPTPFGLMYGVEVHANALNTILMNNFITPLEDYYNIAILLLFILLICFYSSRMSTPVAFILTLFISLGFFFISNFIVFDIYNTTMDVAFPIVAGLFSFVSIVVYRVMTEEKDKRLIRETFGKYVNPSVVDQILSNPPELGGVDKELTVLFSDIRGFTTLSETMTPQELVNHLNVYLTEMTNIIFELDGTLDKYVGDEIMCFWGAPISQEDHALRACKCAIRQMDALRKLNESWPPEKRLNIGIGINSGIMTVGNMGSPGRMNYTLMGDNVNLGARLEGTNKMYMTNIIISEYTYALVKEHVIVRELDNIRVKGKNKPVLIYELIDIVDE
ncbi:adenylate/guanylate cyclase domain-containing protein [Spirochaetia bacterium 38H-sp]|uniref:Adenylate/guanylate cyclase domain-containing protein n=1 Tax=Rarispira pelagica TaxID=3141764 RepID=A0ABU9UAP7_9SPIR